jgi:putative transposase
MAVHSRGQESPKSNHFIEAHSCTAIGAISINKLLALMTKNDSMNGSALVVFIEKLLSLQLWQQR